MKGEQINPFNITKAVDFSDQQISDYWVDIQDDGGFAKLTKPLSAMPMLILGGKGSGKTHLMRYLSYSLQKIRHPQSIIDGILADRYLGIYMRCGGLNSGRFQDKGRSPEAWAGIFSYYMDIWLAQIVIGIVRDALRDSSELQAGEAEACSRIWQLFEAQSEAQPETLEQLGKLLNNIQNGIDHQVNNCAITGALDVIIRSTRGKLVFGIPRVVASCFPCLKECLFVFLIDELENLSEEQQKYINTLIREKEPPCSFKVGAKLYGVKTYRTYSADEENKEGSEFETVWLDEWMRSSDRYELFAKRLIAKRLHEYGYLSARMAPIDTAAALLNDWFETYPASKFAQAETKFISEKYKDKERPYFESLLNHLKKAVANRTSPGITSEDDITYAVNCLRCPQYPLLEKLNIFLLYRDWAARRNLKTAAVAIQGDCLLEAVRKVTLL
ncbi:hypothetical protein [Fimbriiglobus ruber]|uniref:Uncharacterized protein n=1 Tax=Fimbriiglobus ruber TaxID=1908690 RepID=A0A225DNM0_9BACT|nr:hypothetical protein [Fimbriiglobus ruber]OWK37935.1 hypothetical protein FRUB_07055 [Fimbriiglobus ruber]